MLFKKKISPVEKIYDQDLVGCLGKLPVHSEFIKHRIILPETAQLDQWYQSAYHHLHRCYGAKTKDIFLQMPIQHFITIAPQQMTLLGSLAASQDQSGRAYPFVIFRFPQHPLAKEFSSLLPLFYQDFFSMNQQFSDQHWPDVRLPDILHAVNQFNQTATILNRSDYLKNALLKLQNISLYSWWQRLGISALNLMQFNQVVISQLHRYQQHTLLQKPVILRLPLPSGDDLLAGLLFWLQLLSAIIPAEKQRLQLFWHSGNATHRPCLLISTKPMPYEYFIYVVDQHKSAELIIDLLHPTVEMITVSTAQQTPHFSLQQTLLQTLPLWSKQLLTLAN